MISATFDTSVYVRALVFGGPAALLIGHARAEDIRIDISGAILDETIGVLRGKFNWDGYRVHDAYVKLRSRRGQGFASPWAVWPRSHRHDSRVH